MLQMVIGIQKQYHNCEMYKIHLLCMEVALTILFETYIFRICATDLNSSVMKIFIQIN